MKIRLVISVIIITCSCSSNSSQLSLNEGEKKALDSIISLYGGEVSCSKELILFGSNTDSIFCRISLQESDLIKDFNQYKYLPPSNIVLIYYSFLLNEERKDYYKYRVNVDYDTEIKSFEYTQKKLEIAYNCYKETSYLLNLLEDENYDSLKSKVFVNELFYFDKEALMLGLKEITKEYGEINKNEIAGFTFHNTDSGFNFVKVYGISYRQKGNNLFSFFVDSKNYRVFKIEYKW